MNKDNMNESNGTEWIRAMENRLRWFMEEATDEEFDEQEVDTLVDWLSKHKPVEDVDKKNDAAALASFHEYVKMREAEEQETKRVFAELEREELDNKQNNLTRPTNKGNSLAEQDGRENIQGKKSVNVAKMRKLVTVAAAVLVVILVAVGSLGAVKANQGNGFFYWLQKDDEGMTMISSPKDMNEKEEVGYTEKYDTLESVPDEYLIYAVDKDKISQLQDFELEYVLISQGDSFWRMVQWYVDKSGGKNISIGAVVYDEDIRITRESHLSKDVQDIERNEGIEEGILLRENSSGEEEGRFFFYVQNVKYFVDGDVETEMLQQIAESYRDMVLNP